MNYSIEYFIDKYKEKNCLIGYYVNVSENDTGTRYEYEWKEYLALKEILPMFFDIIYDQKFREIAYTTDERILLALEVEKDLRDWRRE